MDTDQTSTATLQKPTLPRSHAVVRDEWNGKPCLRVVGLPVFAEHEREVGGEVVKVDEAFLGDMAHQMAARAAEGWLPAIHEEHNGPLVGPRRRLGFASNPRVGRAVLEGSERSVLFVDALVEDEDDLETLEHHCFRSPEVNLGTRSIESIAAMQSEAPWFKFPIPQFEREPGASLPAEDAIAYSVIHGPEVLAYSFQSPSGLYRALYRFPAQYSREGEVMDEEVKKPMDEDEQNYEEGAPDEALLGKLCELLLPMLMQKMAPQPEAAPVVMSRTAPTTSYTASDSQGAAVEAAFTARFGSMEAQYKARLDASEARLKEIERRHGTEAALGWARSQVRGIVIPADFDETVSNYAAGNHDTTDPRNPLVVYVNTLRAASPVLPPSPLSDEARFYSGEPEAIAQYVAEGGPKAAIAREAVALYNATPASLRPASLEAFIEKRMNNQDKPLFGRNGAA